MKDSEMKVGTKYLVSQDGKSFEAVLREKLQHRYPLTNKLIYVYRLERCSDKRSVVVRHQRFISAILN